MIRRKDLHALRIAAGVVLAMLIAFWSLIIWLVFA